MIPDPNRRGSGMTTKQMTDAPPGATFVWCNDQIGYARLLAAKIGRRDLRIVGSGALGRDAKDRLAGVTAVILDHAIDKTRIDRAVMSMVLDINSRRAA